MALIRRINGQVSYRREVSAKQIEDLQKNIRQ